MRRAGVRNRTRVKMDIGLFIFRLGIALTMLFYHGIPKFELLISGDEIQFADPVGMGIVASFLLATFAEFLCSILVLTGLWTRLAALILTANMVVATFVHLSTMPFDEPTKQLAFLFMLGFAMIAVSGAGGLSLDRFLLRRS